MTLILIISQKRLAIFIGIEICWNIYPATAISSLVLLSCHLVLLFSLFFNKQVSVPEDSKIKSKPKPKPKIH